MKNPFWLWVVIMQLTTLLLWVHRRDDRLSENPRASAERGRLLDSYQSASVRLGAECARSLDSLEPLEQGAFIVTHPACAPAFEPVVTR